MNAKEIRDEFCWNRLCSADFDKPGERLIIIALGEIAAQLAELNGNIRNLSNIVSEK